jgi:hypothetical protein
MRSGGTTALLEQGKMAGVVVHHAVTLFRERPFPLESSYGETCRLMRIA